MAKKKKTERKQRPRTSKTLDSQSVTGTLRMHSRGFGFVQPDDPVAYPQDIFIPKHLTQNGVDGDHVEVQINPYSNSEKGPDGAVTAILVRNRTHAAGIIRTIPKTGDAIAYVPLLGTAHQVQVESDIDEPLRVGDRVVMEILEWGNATQPTRARVSHRLGHITDPKTDISAAIEEFDLRHDFSHEVIQEAEAFGTRVTSASMKSGREDLRDLECVTIDPDTAKDFDDAVSISKEADGTYRLGVHIADVSHYVRPGSALDDEAALRCNSTYFPGTCVPMLPPALSENLCSLKPNVNRLTASVMMTFASDGTLLNHRIIRSVIHSAKRLTYSEAKQILDGKNASPHAPLLKLMVELCERLKRKRYERGSIEFSLPDIVVVVDRQSGVPSGTEVIEYDITHQMIEEFMLKANEVVAAHLTEQGKGLTYRVHEEPAEENMREFAQLAATFGFRISDKPTSEELQALFQEALHTPYGPYLATSFIRSMRLAVYSAENIGHYGLRLTHYCHFTSPIRRYVDLVVHRILFGDKHAEEQLVDISKRCSEQERLSAKAENTVVTLKKLRLIAQRHEKEPFDDYEAIVTRVKPFGFSFEVLDFMLEGFVHISQIGADYFIYEETPRRLRGRHTGKTYATGDRIRVRIKAIDLILLESSWELLETPSVPTVTPIRPNKPKKTKSKSNQPPRAHKKKKPAKRSKSAKRRR